MRPLRLVPNVVDVAVERAIGLMQRELARDWTVSQIAKQVGLSRAAFARRFAHAQRVSPLRFLTRLRMQTAAELLGHSDQGLAQIAQRVGYRSEFAFNRAFKRHHGVAPGVFRRQGAPEFRMAA